MEYVIKAVEKPTYVTKPLQEIVGRALILYFLLIQLKVYTVEFVLVRIFLSWPFVKGCRFCQAHFNSSEVIRVLLAQLEKIRLIRDSVLLDIALSPDCRIGGGEDFDERCKTLNPVLSIRFWIELLLIVEHFRIEAIS